VLRARWDLYPRKEADSSVLSTGSIVHLLKPTTGTFESNLIILRDTLQRDTECISVLTEQPIAKVNFSKFIHVGTTSLRLKTDVAISSGRYIHSR
jgi:hypothetical protein